MVDRFMVWVGVGVITAGLSAAMLAGAGLAVATEGSPSDNGGGTTSESSDSPGNDDDSKESGSTDTPDGDDDAEDADDQDGADDPTDPDEDATDATDATDADDDATDVSDDEAIDTEQASDEAAESDDDGKSGSRPAETDGATARVDHSNTRVAVDDETAADEKALVKDTEQEDVVEAVAPEVGATQRAVVTLEDAAEQITETPEATAVAFAAPATAAIDAAAAAPQIPGIIRVLGTIVFNLYAVATRLVGGPPTIPASSNVSVRSSTLVLECGCNDGDTIEVPADWYVPEYEEGQEPQRLIYLQHGFLASGPWYSHTAAALAEQTNSIVVAPSITSNFLAADACWLGAPPMHDAIADLFDDENTALADSAEAAGLDIDIPDRVVLIGHSLGGGAVIGAAGAMSRNGDADKLAGVIMLDGVPLDPAAVDSIDDVPDDIPIYNLAAPKYFWNQFGVGTDALLEARPYQFIGFTLTGGSHVDSMRGGNPLIQFSQQLVSGFSKPRNVEAARTLMVGWANDMFDPDVDTDGVDDGIYADPTDPSAPVLIDTPAGQATAVPLPNTLEKPFILNPLQSFVSLGSGFFTFEPTCVAASMGTARCTDSIAA